MILKDYSSITSFILCWRSQRVSKSEFQSQMVGTDAPNSQAATTGNNHATTAKRALLIQRSTCRWWLVFIMAMMAMAMVKHNTFQIITSPCGSNINPLATVPFESPPRVPLIHPFGLPHSYPPWHRKEQIAVATAAGHQAHQHHIVVPEQCILSLRLPH